MEGFKVYGFEDYRTYCFFSSFLTEPILSYYDCKDKSYSYRNTILIPQNPDYNSLDNHFGIEENVDILNTAKSLYIHPSCKIARALVSQKYKKSLNPWLADGVVLPNKPNNSVSSQQVALFINDTVKCIVVIFLYYDPDLRKSLSERIDKKPLLKDVMVASVDSLYEKYPGVLEAQLDYCGESLQVNKADNYIVDVVTGSIPKTNVIFDTTLMAALGDEDNKPTADNLMAIYDMLNSPDNDIVGAGIKALSNLDYTNYPNSVICLLLYKGRSLKTNKACNSTSVKYMLKSLFGNNRSWYYSDNRILEKDYELLVKLKARLCNTSEEQALSFLKHCPFIYEDVNMIPIPRLK